MKLNTAPNAAHSINLRATKAPFAVKTSVRAGIAGGLGPTPPCDSSCNGVHGMAGG